jgi:arsenate reductase
MPSVLFICTHNAARSQMGEAYLRTLGGVRFEVESAGIEPGRLNPWVVRALAEDGIDISGKTPQDVFTLYKAGRRYTHVITVCSKEAAEKCPIFPGGGARLHWPFDDPATFRGTDEEIMARVREVRDAIKARVAAFVAEAAP